MNLDWSILQGIQHNMVCPFLDVLMPKITALGNGGAIWLLAAGGLLCTKKYRKQGVLLLGGLALGGFDREWGAETSGRAASPLLAGFQRTAADSIAVGLLISLRAYPGLSGWGKHADHDEPKIWLGGDSTGGTHCVFPPIPLCPFPQRYFGRCDFGRSHRRMYLCVGRQAAGKAMKPIQKPEPGKYPDSGSWYQGNGYDEVVFRSALDDCIASSRFFSRFVSTT